MRCSSAVRVCQWLQNCHGSRSKCKTCDKPINFIVRVIFRPGLKLAHLTKLSCRINCSVNIVSSSLYILVDDSESRKKLDELIEFTVNVADAVFIVNKQF